jgi:hypothetical protein
MAGLRQSVLKLPRRKPICMASHAEPFADPDPVIRKALPMRISR